HSNVLQPSWTIRRTATSACLDPPHAASGKQISGTASARAVLRPSPRTREIAAGCYLGRIYHFGSARVERRYKCIFSGRSAGRTRNDLRRRELPTDQRKLF